MSVEPVRRIRRKPRVDFDWINDRAEGCEGSITLHFKRESGFQPDKVEVRLFECAPERHNKA